MEWDLRSFLDEEIGYEEPIVRRRNLFAKLVRLEKKHGLPVTQIIAGSWEEATNHCKRSTKERMFCWLVKRRLQEAHLWNEDRTFEGKTLEEILQSGIFARKKPMPLFDKEEKPPPRPGHHPSCQRPACNGCQ